MGAGVRGVGAVACCSRSCGGRAARRLLILGWLGAGPVVVIILVVVRCTVAIDRLEPVVACVARPTIPMILLSFYGIRLVEVAVGTGTRADFMGCYQQVSLMRVLLGPAVKHEDA